MNKELQYSDSVYVENSDLIITSIPLNLSMNRNNILFFNSSIKNQKYAVYNANNFTSVTHELFLDKNIKNDINQFNKLLKIQQKLDFVYGIFEPIHNIAILNEIQEIEKNNIKSFTHIKKFNGVLTVEIQKNIITITGLGNINFTTKQI